MKKEIEEMILRMLTEAADKPLTEVELLQLEKKIETYRRIMET